jgi:hypothetical protein
MKIFGNNDLFNTASFWLVWLSVATLLTGGTAVGDQRPRITGKPVIDAPLLLAWPLDREVSHPQLSDPTSNLLYDFHAQLSACDLAFSTEGNYHPALRELWPRFLAQFKDRPPANWFYTTSPPVPLDQITRQGLEIGNLLATCRPSLVVATRQVLDKLARAGLTEGPAYPLYQDRGAVILVKKGNPQQIRTVWDLGRDGVRLVTPNPDLEPGAFNSYLGTIYGIASQDEQPPPGARADELINRIFNGAGRDPDKWLAGPRIHHRDLPWSVAYGRAEAAVIYYHLGLYTKRTFPDLFEVVPLGGTEAAPQPLPGTVIGTRLAVRIQGDWTPRQREARDLLLKSLLSEEFTAILEKHGLVRPPAAQRGPVDLMPGPGSPE